MILDTVPKQCLPPGIIIEDNNNQMCWWFI